MPVYEYICNLCVRSFSVLVLGSTPEPECPYCSSRDIKKKLSSFSCGSSGGQDQPGPAFGAGG